MSGHDLNLRILGVEPGEEADGARRLTLQTTRGDIALIVHGASAPGRAVLCLSGALGGLDGPSKLYSRLGASLPRHGITVTRLDYRVPNEFGECVLDAMAGLSFLKAMHDNRVAIGSAAPSQLMQGRYRLR